MSAHNPISNLPPEFIDLKIAGQPTAHERISQVIDNFGLAHNWIERCVTRKTLTVVCPVVVSVNIADEVIGLDPERQWILPVVKSFVSGHGFTNVPANIAN